MAFAVASFANVLVCYRVARPVAGLGILMPSFISPLVSASVALLLSLNWRLRLLSWPARSGPLVGADLMHLKEIKASESGIVSVGGAGAFDGIVLSVSLPPYLV